MQVLPLSVGALLAEGIAIALVQISDLQDSKSYSKTMIVLQAVIWCMCTLFGVMFQRAANKVRRLLWLHASLGAVLKRLPCPTGERGLRPPPRYPGGRYLYHQQARLRAATVS